MEDVRQLGAFMFPVAPGPRTTLGGQFDAVELWAGLEPYAVDQDLFAGAARGLNRSTRRCVLKSDIRNTVSPRPEDSMDIERRAGRIVGALFKTSGSSPWRRATSAFPTRSALGASAWKPPRVIQVHAFDASAVSKHNRYACFIRSAGS